MRTPSRPRLLPLLLALVSPVILAETPPNAATGAGLSIDTKDGSFCGIKLGDQGLDTLSKLPYPDGQELKDAQEAFKQSMKSRIHFSTLVPGLSDVKLGFNRFDGTLIEIQCQSRDFKTVEGLGVGSTVAEFTKAFGGPVQTIPLQPGTVYVYWVGVLNIYAFTRSDNDPDSVVFRMSIQRSRK